MIAAYFAWARRGYAKAASCGASTIGRLPAFLTPIGGSAHAGLRGEDYVLQFGGASADVDVYGPPTQDGQAGFDWVAEPVWDLTLQMTPVALRGDGRREGA